MARQAQDEVTIPVEAVMAMQDEAAKVKGQPQGKTFTEDEVENIRKQEKDKLYKKMEESERRVKVLEEQLTVISSEREKAIKEAEERAKKEAEAIRQREIEELSVKDLLLKKEDEFNQRINDVEAQWRARLEEIEKDRQAQAALLEKERRHQELQNYIARRANDEQEYIIPELLPLIGGSSEEEVELSISKYREASSAILDSIQKASAQQQGRLKGAGVTAPPVGPMETQMEQQTLTAEDIRNMSMEQYQKMRERLLNARSSRGRF
jgi:hypothetical protein